jgi:serine/threonine-protein kinase HipA
LVTAEQLAVWLYDTRVALVDQLRGRLRLSYTEDSLTRYGLGVPLLSLSLPIRPERYTHGLVRPFLDGLLPEGEPRQIIANDLGLARDDTYGLIAALGRDCAGAIVIQPADEPPPPKATTRTAAPISASELEGLITNLRSAPLGIGGPVRISLAGVQEKLVLTRMPKGRWGRPVEGTPSTHILKPEIDRYPQTVENELFCMRLARELGLRVPNVEMLTVGGRRVIVVERYDRVVLKDGSVERIHQEDFCQATGVLPEKKYEEDGGPSLRRIAELLQSTAALDSLDEFLRAVTLNVIVGNGDAHAKNYSLLHESSGLLRLAPVYDVLSTLIYGDHDLAAYIDNVRRIDQVTGDRLLNEAARWGIAERRAKAIVRDILDRAPAASAAAQAQTPGLPATLATIVDAQVTRLREGLASPASVMRGR